MVDQVYQMAMADIFLTYNDRLDQDFLFDRKLFDSSISKLNNNYG